MGILSAASLLVLIGYEREPVPECVSCFAPLTVKHKLVDAVDFSPMREKYYRVDIAGRDRCPASIAASTNVIYYDGSCYEFILDHPGNWHVADQDCKSRGGYLVDIHTYAEQGFLYNSVTTLGLTGDKGIWIGLSDEEVENDWRWVSGKSLSFKNWGTDQPGMVGGFEDCVLMEFGDGGYWHDYPCDGIFIFAESHGWICEYDVPAK